VFRRLIWFASEQKHKPSTNGKALFPTTVNDVLSRYPIDINGFSTPVRPHDLRRTYALRCYEAGMEMVRIQRNLGHVNTATTLKYIGSLDGNLRRPPAAYHYPSELFEQLEKSS
jgi:integrase